MKFDKSRDKADPSLDSACYRKFLAGNRTQFSKAFWENSPRSGSLQRVKAALAKDTDPPTEMSN